MENNNNNNSQITVCKGEWTSGRGNHVKIFSTRSTARSNSGFLGGNESVRTWISINGGQHEIDTEPGCAFRLTEAVVAEAGF